MDKKLKNGSFAIEVDTLPDLWRDRKRFLGMPISFTVYALNADKLMINTGFFNLKQEEILLYRIRDITVQESFGERIFGVGTVIITSADSSHPTVALQHVKKARMVKEALSKCIEQDRANRNIRATELMDSNVSGEMDEGLLETGDVTLDEVADNNTL